MSGGWIKLEKDLREDLRVKRMARLLAERHPVFCNAGAFQDGVILITVVLGALAQLWMHADTFARQDDTLDITSAEIDQLAGIQDFSQILPGDWLEILNPDCVKLPEFQEHNGSEAKRKAQTAKRVSKHRAEHPKRSSVTASIQPETQVRYQTRPDQTKTRPDQTMRKSAARATGSESNGSEAQNGTEPPCDSLPYEQAIRAKFPKGSNASNWQAALHYASTLVGNGAATWPELEDAVGRYARYFAASGQLANIAAHNFFDPRKSNWSQPWDLPTTKGQLKQDANLDAARTWLAQSEGK